jgi:hypothetical protein
VRIPVQPAFTAGQPADGVVDLLARNFAKSELGAVLIGGSGPLIVGADVHSVFSLTQTMENIARASLFSPR